MEWKGREGEPTAAVVFVQTLVSFRSFVATRVYVCVCAQLCSSNSVTPGSSKATEYNTLMGPDVCVVV